MDRALAISCAGCEPSCADWVPERRAQFCDAEVFTCGRFHVGGVAGGHCDYWDSGLVSDGGGAVGAGIVASYAVSEQPAAVGDRIRVA